MKRWSVGVLVLAAALFGTILFLSRGRSKSPDGGGPGVPPVLPSRPAVSEFSDDFSSPALDASRWTLCSEGDFKEKTVDILEGRLRLRCGTIGTDDRTVKFLGARSISPLRLGRETRLTAEIDWNKQANGSYLSGALILSPQDTGGNPLTGPDWLRVEYVGVPPGKNGRLVVASRTAGRERYLFTEGWPEKDRQGRAISLQKVELVLKGGGFELSENGTVVYECKDKVVSFATAHLYIQMSSHSNYPPRQIFFDNVRWSAAE